MSKLKQPLPIMAPIIATSVALGDFAACLFMVCAHPSIGPLSFMILAELVLIALAIAQWVRYAQGYIARQVREQLDRPREEA